MLVIKALSSHVNLNTGENSHTMVVGRVDQQEGVEIDLDPITYMQLGQVAQELRGQGPVQHTIQGQAAPGYEENEALRQEVFAPERTRPKHRLAEEGPADVEERLMQQLRDLEDQSGGVDVPVEGAPSNAEDLLRQVGWFDGSPEPPNDALSDFLDDESDDPDDPGEGYPEDDGVEEA